MNCLFTPQQSTLFSLLAYHFWMYFPIFRKEKGQSILALIHIIIWSNTFVYTVLMLYLFTILKEAISSMCHLSYIYCELIHSVCFSTKQALTNCLLSISVVFHDRMQNDLLNHLMKKQSFSHLLLQHPISLILAL